MPFAPEDLLKILLALLAGGTIGLEREYRDKAAGFRTIIFICLGSALFTILSIEIAGDKDPARVAANIVTGVGFLGAGVVMREGGRILGLTTAAIIWLTAAIGMSIGSGQYTLAMLVTALTLLVLWLFPPFERWIDRAREEHLYEVTLSRQPDKCAHFDALLKQSHLWVRSRKRLISADEIVCTWDVLGAPKNHQRFIEALLADKDVKSIRC